MPISQLINSFNSGEWTPLAWARSDLDKYRSGCQILRNFIILPYGGCIRRPGSQFQGAAKRADKRCRLVGFNFSTTTNFLLEFGEGYLRFWSRTTGELVESAPDVILELETPYLEADLRFLQYIQINDLMYIVHPSYEPMKLSRLADDNWTIAPLSWEWPPLLDENTDDITIAASGTTGSVTLTASAPAWVTATNYSEGQFVSNGGNVYKAKVAHTSAAAFATDAAKWELFELFSANLVGAYFSIGHRRDNSYVELSLGATGNSSPVEVLGDWELTTYGTWDGRLKLQRSYNGSTWETVRTPWESGGERNVSTTGKEDKLAKLRLSYSADGAGSSSPKARLEAGDNRIYGLVKITAYASATSVTATVITPLFATDATKVWAEGAFSNKRGFPRTVCLHETRLIFGGNQHRPLSVWGSVIDDFENFRYSDNDDGAFLFTLSSNESNPINWMVSQGKLLIGTAGNEWTLGAADESQVLSPSNVQAKFQSSFGSKYMQARVVNEVVIFAQRQGRKFRELTYSFEKDGWVAPDLNVLAEHAGEGEFLEVAFQQQPNAIFWAITGNGILSGMTYEREQQVVGWHSHDTAGTFESVATVYGGDGADEVWLSVRRVVNGETVRYIERFDPDFRAVLDRGDKPEWWYLDCARRSVFVDEEDEVTGLEHLNGLTVGILADGATQPSRLVESGEISLQLAAKKVLVGLPYTSTLKPLSPALDLQDGTSQGRKSRVHRILVRLYKSMAGQYSCDGVTWFDLPARGKDDPMDDSPPTFTGFHDVYSGSTWADAADLMIRQTLPLPLCVLALVPKWDASGE